MCNLSRKSFFEDRNWIFQSIYPFFLQKKYLYSFLKELGPADIIGNFALIYDSTYAARKILVHNRLLCPLPSTIPLFSISQRHKPTLTYSFSRSSLPFFPRPYPTATSPSTSPMRQTLFRSRAASSSIFEPSLWLKTQTRRKPMNSRQTRLQDCRPETISRQAFTRAASRPGNVRSTWHSTLLGGGTQLWGLMEPGACMLLRYVILDYLLLCEIFGNTNSTSSPFLEWRMLKLHCYFSFKARRWHSSPNLDHFPTRPQKFVATLLTSPHSAHTGRLQSLRAPPLHNA